MAEPTATADLMGIFKVLDSINLQLSSLNEQMRDQRERLIRLESHGYAERIKAAEDELDVVRNRLTVLETKGQSTTAFIGAAASIVTSVITAAVLYLFNKG